MLYINIFFRTKNFINKPPYLKYGVYYMIKIPEEQIIARLKKEANISEDEINEKVKAKLDQLSGLISREGALHIIANELGVKLFDKLQGKLKISSILSGMRDVETVGKVQKIFDLREFKTEKREGKVQNIIIADETGAIRIVLWNSQVDNIKDLKENDVVKIINTYVKENQGKKELHLGDRSKIEINPEGESIAEVKQFSTTRKNIKDLQENDENIELLGTIVQVFDPRFYEICPECGKRARARGEDAFVCDEHGEVKPLYSYVMNLFLDDGTENIRAVFFKNQAERLTSKSENELMIIRSDPPKFEEVKNQLLGNIIKIVGRVTKNTMFDRLEFITQLVFTNPDPEQELKRLDEEIKEAKTITQEETV